MPRIDLGVRLNHLINQETKLGRNKKSNPGLILSGDDGKDPGTGTVVIVGEPGSGKSTLALQIAYAAARSGYNSAYISLEEEPARIVRKANVFGWDKYIYQNDQPVDFLAGTKGIRGDSASLLESIIKNAHKIKIEEDGRGRILLPGLLPRPLATNGNRLQGYFWDQYRHIEGLVKSAKKMNDKSSDKTMGGIRLVVIDSLNMLGIDTQNREMLHRLFDLFRQNQIIGVLTTEANDELGFDSTMGDLVFNFSKLDDHGYSLTMLECAKSRFTNRTKGLHPYKIKSPTEKMKGDNVLGEVGIVVYPSAHAVVAATTPDSKSAQSKSIRRPSSGSHFPFGWGRGITHHLLRSTLHRGDVVTLAGPDGTFKSQIAANFLLHGMVSTKAESSLYLRLRDHDAFSVGNIMLYSKEVVFPTEPEDDDGRSDASKNRGKTKINREAGKLDPDQTELKEREQLIISGDKITKVSTPFDLADKLQSIQVVEKFVIGVHAKQKNPGADPRPALPVLVVVDFPTGLLLPEEFIDIVRRIQDIMASPGNGIAPLRRVVLDDVSAIGVSYPLLAHSVTTGDMFLSSFVHIMRNSKVDLLMVGSTSDYKESNRIVNQACSLADSVLKASVDAVFGDKYVLLSGDGMYARHPLSGDTPPVVLLPEKGKLIPDATLLDEFVGFDTGNIQRPGIVLHVYQEGAIKSVEDHYYEGLQERLQDRYGASLNSNDKIQQRVKINRFTPENPFRITAEVASGSPERPMDHTSIRMVDEFEKFNSKKSFLSNVLLMAYRSDDVKPNDKGDSIEFTSWRDVLKVMTGVRHSGLPKMINEPTSQYGPRFAFSRIAPETLSCLILDAMISAGILDRFPAPRGKMDKLKSVNIAVRLNRAAKTRTGSVKIKLLIDEFVALSTLLRMCTKCDSRSQDFADPILLPTNASVYVCWYTQLRDLIRRAPHLAGLLRVCPLPGGGFSGDWSLHVEDGSVSRRLGNTIIEALISRREDYERMALGLGLPADEEFFKNVPLLAWPGANYNVLLGKVSTGNRQSIYNIWKKANLRSMIKDYHKFNRLLSMYGSVFSNIHTGPMEDDADKYREFIKYRVEKLGQLLSTFESS